MRSLERAEISLRRGHPCRRPGAGGAGRISGLRLLRAPRDAGRRLPHGAAPCAGRATGTVPPRRASHAISIATRAAAQGRGRMRAGAAREPLPCQIGTDRLRLDGTGSARPALEIPEGMGNELRHRINRRRPAPRPWPAGSHWPLIDWSNVRSAAKHLNSPFFSSISPQPDLARHRSRTSDAYRRAAQSGMAARRDLAGRRDGLRLPRRDRVLLVRGPPFLPGRCPVFHAPPGPVYRGRPSGRGAGARCAPGSRRRRRPSGRRSPREVPVSTGGRDGPGDPPGPRGPRPPRRKRPAG